MLNHIELAKECGEIHEEEAPLTTETITFFGNQLTAYTNAVIEMCAKVVDDNEFIVHGADIRAIKVKG